MSCKEKIKLDEEPEIHVGISYPCYAHSLDSIINSYVQVGDSIYKFNAIEGFYCSYIPTFNNNNFRFFLKDSLHSYQHCVNFDIFTKIMDPEAFFQKGIWEIDTFYVSIYLLGLSHRKEYYGIRSIFTWHSVSYEDWKFTGKGSFEIMDTLFTNYPEIYYTPQKIEFEFK